MHGVGAKFLTGQVSARNAAQAPPTKMFAGSAPAMLVAMRREALRRGAADATTVQFAADEIRILATPLSEEDLSHEADEIIL
ncbi:unnamed protein product, partial [Sphacelaria rigidula]